VNSTLNDLVDVKDLVVKFQTQTRIPLVSAPKSIRAVNYVSFTIHEHETFGLAGETGSGKSTIAKVLVGLLKPTSGSVFLLGRKIDFEKKCDIVFLRENVGIVFQDPVRSLNPRLTVRDIISEGLRASRSKISQDDTDRISSSADLVGLRKSALTSYPRELSGGERQRVSLARALVSPRKLLVLDEPTSSLDVSVQAQVLNTLKWLKSRLGLSYLFITHDLKVIRFMSSTLGILFFGKMVESGTTPDLMNSPMHPYTKTLLKNAFPKDENDLEVPTSEHQPASTGCVYRKVCPHVFEKCTEEPGLMEVGNGHITSCFLYDREAKKQTLTTPSNGAS
jgi:oligopeptide/dipeptide ABC transporter ATP-binding protein